MQKHIGRVVRYGWLPLVALVTVLIADMQTATANADKNIRDLLVNFGIANPSANVASHIWSHPWALIVAIVLIFAVGAALSWLMEWLWKRVFVAKPLSVSTFGYDNHHEGSVPPQFASWKSEPGAPVAAAESPIAASMLVESAVAVDLNSAPLPGFYVLIYSLKVGNQSRDGRTLRGLEVHFEAHGWKRLIPSEADTKLLHGTERVIEFGTMLIHRPGEPAPARFATNFTREVSPTRIENVRNGIREIYIHRYCSAQDGPAKDECALTLSAEDVPSKSFKVALDLWAAQVSDCVTIETVGNAG